MTKAPLATSVTQEQIHDAVPTSPISRRLIENQRDMRRPAADGGSVGWVRQTAKGKLPVGSDTPASIVRSGRLWQRAWASADLVV